MPRGLTHKDFLKNLKIKNKAYARGDFEVIGEYVKSSQKLLTRNKYGECLITGNALISGSIPRIEAAVNQNEYIVNIFQEKHGEIYNYSLVDYKKARLPVEIICREHGSFFQSPDTHSKGIGCMRCGRKSILIPREIILQRFLELNSDLEITNISSVNSTSDLCYVICKRGHKYSKTMRHILDGYGCRKCYDTVQTYRTLKNKDFTDSRVAIFYVMHFSNEKESFYKIGITMNLKRRLIDLRTESKMNVQLIQTFEKDLKFIIDFEDSMKVKYKHLKHSPRKKFGGCTECFKEDILKLELKEKI